MRSTGDLESPLGGGQPFARSQSSPTLRQGLDIEPQLYKRRFRLLDALLLTAAVALAFGASSMLNSVAPLPSGTDAVTMILRHSLTIQLVVVTTTWSLAMLVLSDRRRRHDSTRSPGKLALVNILAASVFAIPVNWGDLVTAHLPVWSRIAFLPFSILSFPAVPGCVAISGWLTLRLSSSDRPHADWLEISGNIVACVWIIYAFATPLRSVPVLRAIGVTM